MENIGHDSNSLVKPIQVRFAVGFLYASLVVGIVQSFLALYPIGSQSSMAFTIAAMVVVVGATIFLVAMIALGKNWARIAFLALFAIGIPCSIPGILQGFADSLLAGLVSIIQEALQVTAIILLFQGSSDAWFRRQIPSTPEVRSLQQHMRPLGLLSVVIGLLAWTVFFSAIYLLQQVPTPYSILTIEEIERRTRASIWFVLVIPNLLAIVACLSGILATVKHWHTSKLTRAISIAGTLLGGGYPLLSCGLVYLAIQVD
jgi:hypothetical protein